MSVCVFIRGIAIIITEYMYITEYMCLFLLLALPSITVKANYNYRDKNIYILTIMPESVAVYLIYR